MRIRFKFAACVAAVLLPFAAAMGQQASSPVKPYQPGLGEFMLATQTRHAKLWLSGNLQNWELADYAIDELKEGLEDVEKYIPVFRDIPIGKMIATTIMEPIKAVEDAIKARDRAKFVAAYDRLTAACNSCHTAASRPFILIQRPSGSPYPNQSFAPSRK